MMMGRSCVAAGFLLKFKFCTQVLCRFYIESGAEPSTTESLARQEDTQYSCRSTQLKLFAPSFLTRYLQLRNVPFHIFGAKAKNQFRKPMPGMWYELENVFRKDGIEIGALYPDYLWYVRLLTRYV